MAGERPAQVRAWLRDPRAGGAGAGEGRLGFGCGSSWTATRSARTADTLCARERVVGAKRSDASRLSRRLEPMEETPPAIFWKFTPGRGGSCLFAQVRLGQARRGLYASTVGHCVRLFSSLFTDLVERGFSTDNPIRTLPRSTRRLYRATTDPCSTPFLESSLSFVQRCRTAGALACAQAKFWDSIGETWTSHLAALTFACRCRMEGW